MEAIKRFEILIKFCLLANELESRILLVKTTRKEISKSAIINKIGHKWETTEEIFNELINRGAIIKKTDDLYILEKDKIGEILCQEPFYENTLNAFCQLNLAVRM